MARSTSSTEPAGCVHALSSFFFQAEDGIRDWSVTGVQTCALPISPRTSAYAAPAATAASSASAQRARTGRRYCRAAMGVAQSGALQSGRLRALVAELVRSEEHTSELQSLTNLVCRLLLEKKKNKRK